MIVAANESSDSRRYSHLLERTVQPNGKNCTRPVGERILGEEQAVRAGETWERGADTGGGWVLEGVAGGEGGRGARGGIGANTMSSKPLS